MGLSDAESLGEFKDGLFMFQYTLGEEAVLTREHFDFLLRPFQWYSHRRRFEDLYRAGSSGLVVMSAYLLHQVRKGENPEEYPLNELNRAMTVLGQYLDSGRIELYENEDTTNVISLPLYGIESELAEVAPADLLGDDQIAGKEKDLRAREDAKLDELLNLTPAERIDALKEKFSEISACKNCVYNIIRSNGATALELLEEKIFKLHPRDQSFFLHGLDAFPNNAEVLAFYDRFLKKNRYSSLVNEVKVYADRVKKGVKTTGWETI